jgi:putative endonuclease
MFYVYLIKSRKDGKYYICYTENIERRLKEHNSGKNRSTKLRTPFIYIGSEKFENRGEARYREYELKNKPSLKKQFIKNLDANIEE